MILGLSVTHQCNVSCRYCGSIERKYDNQQVTPIGYKEICNLLDIGRDYKITHLTITGGEPFLRKDIFEILEYAHELDYTISMFSNGTLINKERAEKLSKISHLNRVRVSMESPQKDLFEYYRGERTYKKALTGIKNLIKYNVPIGVGFTAYPENVSSIEDMAAFCAAKGIPLLRVMFGVSVHRAENVTFSREFIKEVVTRIIKVIHKSNYVTIEPLNPKTAINILSARESPAGKYYYYVDSAGRLVPCPFIPEECSDVLRIQKVESVRDFERMRDYMSGLSERIYHHARGACRTCELRSKCKGGCLTEKITKGCTIYDEQPTCIKHILEEATRKFKRGEIKSVLDLWVYCLYQWKITQMTDMLCIRQLPVWTILLNVEEFSH